MRYKKILTSALYLMTLCCIPFISSKPITQETTAYAYESSEFICEENNTGCTITYVNPKTVNVIIPDTIRGVPVTKLGKTAFRGRSDIISVRLTNNITEIEDGAFQDCTALRTLILPPGLKKIPDNVCNGCTCLDNVVMPKHYTEIGYRAFADCKMLQHIDISPDRPTIDPSACYGCDSMQRSAQAKKQQSPAS